MRIKEKINLEYEGLVEHGPINIVAFGDSVTHGALGTGEINYETVYWNRLKQKINNVRNYIPVNVINAGIGGITANASIGRMEKQVFAHNPDLIIVCFGLNDVNGPLERYINALTKIFERCNQDDVETIFMTPNMLNTYVDPRTLPEAAHIARRTMERCQELGYRVPEDISILGFDDIPLCQTTTPPLTTIRQNRSALGKSAFYAMSSLLNKVAISSLLLHPELKIRSSCGPMAENLDRFAIFIRC